MEENQKVKIFALAINMKDAQSQRDIKVKMVITDGSTVCFYSDAGFAKKVYEASKAKGLKVAFLSRKNAVVEVYEGKTMEQIRDYEIALLKQSGQKYKEIQS